MTPRQEALKTGMIEIDHIISKRRDAREDFHWRRDKVPEPNWAVALRERLMAPISAVRVMFDDQFPLLDDWWDQDCELGHARWRV